MVGASPMVKGAKGTTAVITWVWEGLSFKDADHFWSRQLLSESRW